MMITQGLLLTVILVVDVVLTLPVQRSAYSSRQVGHMSSRVWPVITSETPSPVQYSGSDPLENIGVSIDEGHLIEGDIRQRLRPRRRRPQHQSSPNDYRVLNAGTRQDFPGDSGDVRSYASPASSISSYREAQINDPVARLTPSSFGHELRNSVPMTELTWTNRIIPYVLEQGFNNTELMQINQALTEVMEGSDSCISFVKRQDERDFIYLSYSAQGDVGRFGGNQSVHISRASGCVTKGIVMHELMHVLGFWHEHTRPDRDYKIRILPDNILPNHRGDFDIKRDANLFNISYDFYSLMHYKTNQFSIDDLNKLSFEILTPNVTHEEVGQRKYLSESDKQRIKKLYNCPLQQCSYPHTMTDDYVIAKNTEVGSIAKYSCRKPNSVLIGASERTCQYDGMWSGSTPVCFDGQQTPSYCSFEDIGICGWTQDTTDEADWTRLNSQTPSDNTGPITDHTIQNTDGYYMYLEGSGKYPNTTARLISPTFQPEADLCILFWYNMYGAGMGTMKVYIKDGDGLEHELWSMSGNQNRNWKKDLIADLNIAVPFQIIFEALRGPRDTTDMAIDDVIVGRCPDVTTYENAIIREIKTESYGCNFDKSFCGWTQNTTTKNLSWIRHYGPTPTLYTGPECDLHNCKNGSYIYIESSHSQYAGEAASITSPVIQTKGEFCITFNYHMYGSDIGDLSLITRTKTSSTTIWQARGDKGQFWLNAGVNINTTGTLQIVIIATSGLGFRGDIAVDDITVNYGSCPIDIACNFDQNGICDFVNDNITDDFDWTLSSGSTTPSTGPISDHTTGIGKFIYIEASAPRQPGDTAVLLSPLLEPSKTGHCVTFSYFMYGKDVHILEVGLRYVTGMEKKLWKVEGELGPRWLKHSLQIPPLDLKIQITFEAVVGVTYASDIAIDDITITGDGCPKDDGYHIINVPTQI